MFLLSINNDVWDNVIIYKYNNGFAHSNEMDLKCLLYAFKKCILLLFKHDPDSVNQALHIFIKSMHFDLGFMEAIMKIPFYNFEDLNNEDKQKFLDEIEAIYNKYKTKSNHSIKD